MSFLDQFDQLQEITPTDKWRAGIMSKITQERKNENNQYKGFFLKSALTLTIIINLLVFYLYYLKSNNDLQRQEMKTIVAELFIPSNSSQF